MGRIPTIEPSGVKLTTRAPTQEVDPRMASVDGKMLETFGKGIADIAGDLERARSHVEETKFHNFVETQANDINGRASQEVDLTPDKQQKYLDEYNQVLSKADQYISIPANREMAIAKYSPKLEMQKIKLQNIFFKKFMDTAKAEDAALTDKLGVQYRSATNPKDRERAYLDYVTQIRAGEERGFYNHEQAEKLILDTPKKWEAERIKDQRVAEHKDNMRILKITNDLNWKMHEGALTDADLEAALIQVTGADPNSPKAISFWKTYTALKKNLDAGDLSSDPKKSTGYKDILKLMEDPKKADVGAIQLKIAQHRADKTLTVEEAKELHALAVIPVQGAEGYELKSLDQLIGMEETQNKAQAERLKWVNAAWSGIKSWAGSNTDKAINIFKFFTSHVLKNDIPPEKYVSEASKIIKTSNPNFDKHKVGEMVTNPAGKSGKVIGHDENGSPILEVEE